MKRHYYLFNSGKLRRKENSILLDRTSEDPDKTAEEKQHLAPIGCGGESAESPRITEPNVHIPIQSIESIFCFGETQFSSNVLRFLGKENVPMHIFDYYGNYTSTFYPREEMINGALIVEQVRHYIDPELRLAMARAMTVAAIHNADANLAYYEHRGKNVTRQRIAMLKFNTFKS